MPSGPRPATIIPICSSGIAAERVHALDELNVRGRAYERVGGSLVHQIVLIEERIECVYRRGSAEVPVICPPIWPAE
jgi:hypothetical protein